MSRATQLLLTDFERLEEWCAKVREVFDGTVPYLVGSAITDPDHRDVDVRLILTDKRYDADFEGKLVKVRLLNHALSVWGQIETGLPIDFQIQRQTEANEAFPKSARNPMGSRDWATLPLPGTGRPLPVQPPTPKKRKAR